MEPGFRFRAAQPADYDRIVAVMDDWWGRVVHTGLPRLFLNHFHRTSIIAERDSDLAGFLVGFLSPSVPDTAYIHFAASAPASAAPAWAAISTRGSSASPRRASGASSGRSPRPSTTAPSPSTPRWDSPSAGRSPTMTARQPTASCSSATSAHKERHPDVALNVPAAASQSVRDHASLSRRGAGCGVRLLVAVNGAVGGSPGGPYLVAELARAIRTISAVLPPPGGGYCFPCLLMIRALTPIRVRVAASSASCG